MTDIDVVKVILALGIFGLALLAVFAPWKIAGAPELFSLGNMMASGVLLSAGLVHQLADSAVTLNQPGKFPWAMFIAGSTFLAFMVLEESLHLFFVQSHSHDGKAPLNLHAMIHDHSHSHHTKEVKSSETNQAESHSHEHQHQHNHSSSLEDNKRSRDSTSHSHERQGLLANQRRLHSDSSPYTRMSISCSYRGNGSDLAASEPPPSERRRSTPIGEWWRASVHGSSMDETAALTEHHHHDEHLDLHLHGSIVASLILMVAISIHAVLAGVSIGIEQEPEQIAGTAIAILAHKAFEAFCLGSSFVTAQMSYWSFVILGVSYSFMTPLGIILGEVLSVLSKASEGENGEGDSTMIAIVQAVVAGTFLYISIVEIGTKELLACRHEVEDQSNHSNVEQAKLLFFALGYILMSSLALYA